MTISAEKLPISVDNERQFVIGFGDPVMDIIAHVSNDFLRDIADNDIGGCIPVNSSEMSHLLEKTSGVSSLHSKPGGSAANVTRVLANIAPGQFHCRFVGMVGPDSTGKEYRYDLSQQHVEPLLLVKPDASLADSESARALCWVTPDGQRTMRTCLGASLGLRSSSQLPEDWLSASNGSMNQLSPAQLLHLEGYALYRPQLVQEVIPEAKAKGCLVSIDLASFELVKSVVSKHSDGDEGEQKQALPEALLNSLIKSKNLDLIFANEEEACELSTALGVAREDDTVATKVAAAQRFVTLNGGCKAFVISLGARGCVASDYKGQLFYGAADKVKVVDTIGAGDAFTAGFLAGFLMDLPLDRCCAAGCIAGGEAVQIEGAELPREAYERVEARINALKKQNT
uniref:Carbohydrate kinase PfkB domain-containing protein n=1 Tax=Polytomella parva TaxID=51329 RepID=A0A7S0VBZ2_9CHLO|mmetsp:Transcript_35047/g.63046  ORF Transcript_35047/g.63046 Transcript_35047/m.63046 type:complete len:399 (+) Transcript_35047:130-1326(+)